MDKTSPSEVAIADSKRPLGDTRLAVVVGAAIDQNRRRDAMLGRAPRVDVIEMESELGGAVYDFTWLQQRMSKERLTKLLFDGVQRYLGWSWILAIRVLREMRHTDVVYATGEDVGLPLATLLRLLRRNKPYLVMRMEQLSYGRSTLRRKVFQAYARFAFKRVDMILCRTHAHVRTLVNDWGIAERAVRFVSEPVDPSFFDLDVNGATEDEQVVPPHTYILSAGLENRDYLTLIEAVRGLSVRLIIGAGSPWSKVKFTTDSVPENVQVASFNPRQMRELYRQAAIVVVPVIPSERACGMNVVLEAWAMERPVIASRTAGLVSYIEDGQTGIFVEPGDASALRLEILRLLERPNDAVGLGRAGREKALGNSTVSSYIRTIADVIR